MPKCSESWNAILTKVEMLNDDHADTFRYKHVGKKGTLYILISENFKPGGKFIYFITYPKYLKPSFGTPEFSNDFKFFTYTTANTRYTFRLVERIFFSDLQDLSKTNIHGAEFFGKEN